MGAAVRLYEGSYAQHSGNVVVNRSGGNNNNYAINAGGSVTIDGGKLDASITSEGSIAIYARGNISISGGSVTANATGADSYGVRAKGNITLTWTRATDRITASGYQSTNGTVSLSKRFAFDDGGTVTQATTDNIGGQTLRPAALVTFNANGGSDVAAQTLFVGTAATEPTPTRTDYDLSGWTLGGAAYDFATFVTEDITLTAQWTLHTYTISYDLAGGSVATENPATYTIESEAITLVNPTRDGYTFAGWTGTDLTDVTETVTITTGSTGNRTYIATWTKNELVLSETDGMNKLISDWQGKQVDVSFTRTFSANVASTICLPFAISADQAKAAGNFYTFAGVDTSGSEWVVTMQETNATNDALAANTPYLFMPKQTGTVTFDETLTVPASGGFTPVDVTPDASTYPNATGWTYKGTNETIEWTTDPKTIYGFASGQAYGNSGDETAAGTFIRVRTGGIRPFRAYLQYSGSGNARAMTRSAADVLPDMMTVRLIGADGQPTAIGTLDTRTGEATFGTDEWYTLDGVKLSAKPTAKGIYIYKGKKVIIK